MPEPIEDLAAVDRHRSMIHAAQRQIEHARQRAESSDSLGRVRHTQESRFRMEDAADMLEGYRLEQELHCGGQGVVYRGVQLSTGRTVAIKLLPRGAFAGRNQRLRFEREVQVLGQLEAPGIVRIVDSGVAAGHWWFTMDYIDGLPLDEFVRNRLYEPASGADLTAGSRSRLLSIVADVAEAVHAAHLHGVIHRDLKPRNILVDASGHANVLDFGLAKLDAEHSEAQPDATMTETGQFVGSLPWASPEQAAGEPGEVDLRTDVYSLGVILYQLLTGQFPYRVIGSARDVVQNILTAEPAAPSSLSTSVDDELQTIVLKCLNKEPARRYQSAGDLARDLRRYLAGEPIEAKRDSLVYVLRKKLRRHRAAALVAAGFAVLVAASFVTTVVLWRAAASERDRAIDAERTQAELRAVAESEARKAAETTDFLRRTIGAADPRVAQGRKLTVEEMMQSALHQLDSGQLERQPEIEAAVRSTIGQALLAQGRFDDAAAQAGRALEIRQKLWGREHRDVAQSLVELSEIRSHQGLREESLQLAEEALAIARKVQAGRDHADVVVCLQRLAWAMVSKARLGEGTELMAQAVAMLERLWGPDDVRTMQGRVDQTVMSHDIAGSEQVLVKAIETFRVKLGPRHPDVLASLNMLGGLRQMRGDFAGAATCFREALELTEAVYGRAHPLYLEGLMHMARMYAAGGDEAAAADLLANSLDAARQTYGDASFGMSQYLISLGSYQWQAHDAAAAEESFRGGLEILRALNQDQGGDAAKARVALCEFHLSRDELIEAEALAQQCLAAPEGNLPAGHWTRAQATCLLGEIRRKQGTFDEAERLLLTGYDGLQQQPGTVRFLQVQSVHRLVRLYQEWHEADPAAGKLAEAERWQARLDAMSLQQP